MSNQIINKVQQSALIQLDLADFDPNIELIGIDLKQFLFEGLVLKEKEFRESLKTFEWRVFQNKGVYLFCSEDAIIPSWAYMLVSTYLVGCAHTICQGSIVDLQRLLITEKITNWNCDYLTNKMVILKGCSKLYQSEFALSYLSLKLIPIVRSLMFGEPCSTVPIYKRKNEAKNLD